MKYIDISALGGNKDNLVTIGDTSYWADQYIALPDGSILMANAKEGSDDIIVSKAFPNGTVIHEMNSETTMTEFMELRESVIASLKQREETLRSSVGYNPDDGDDDGSDIIEHTFATPLVDDRDYA